MTTIDDESEHVKEVYARFGLAVYYAQVLEHGIVNALVTLDLIPSKRHEAGTAEKWGAMVDEFMDQHFSTTLGRMIRALRTVTTVPDDLERHLTTALSKRNWLAHNFFRERAEEFMSAWGRDKMLHEVDECREAFRTADRRLDEIVRPIRHKFGLSDEMVQELFEAMRAEARNGVGG